MNWRADKLESDLALPHAKSILGRVLLLEGDWRQDAQENSDLVGANGKRIAVRVRRWPGDVTARWREEFTVRSRRASGRETELGKIRKGLGDWFLYGFTGPRDRSEIVIWSVLDLAVFRAYSRRARGAERWNRDGGSAFRVYRYDAFPPTLVVATHETDVQPRQLGLYRGSPRGDAPRGDERKHLSATHTTT